MKNKTFSFMIAVMISALTLIATPTMAAAAPSVVTQVQTISPLTPEMAPTLGAGPCGWGVCVFLNIVDQESLMAGANVALGAGLCMIGVPCILVGAVLASGYVYLNHYGWCKGQLGIRFAGSSGINCYK